MIPVEDIENWFTYHSPKPEQVKVVESIRDSAKEFAYLLNELLPDCADKTVTMRSLRETVMRANLTVACNS